MINKVILVGNVGVDPEIRTLENGTKVARIRLATTERLYNRQTQETKEHTEWHTITLWRGLADTADRFVRKGSQLYVEGNIRTNKWTDQNGVERYTTEILANDMKLLGRKGDNPQAGAPPSGGFGGESTGAPQGGYQPQPTLATPTRSQSSPSGPAVETAALTRPLSIIILYS